MTAVDTQRIVQTMMCCLLTTLGSSMSIVFLLLLLRFRDLRTMTNLLLAQVAITNFLTLTVGLSIFIDFEILELHKLEGKILAAVILFCERYFNLVNFVSIALVIIDRYMAIEYDLKYTAGWRTKRRIICSMVICWVPILILIILDLTVNNPDLGSVPVWKYKLALSNTVYFDSVKSVFPFMFLILTALTWRSLNKRRHAVKRIGGRKNVIIESDEMKAATTVAIIATCYSCCLGLAILFQRLGKNELYKLESGKFSWYYFFSQYFSTLPSTLNLFITGSRTKRLRRAIRQFFEDPCGSSKLIEFQQHPPINLAPRPTFQERRITRISASMRINAPEIAKYLYHSGCGCSANDITKMSESVIDGTSESSYSQQSSFKRRESSSAAAGNTASLSDERTYDTFF